MPTYAPTRWHWRSARLTARWLPYVLYIASCAAAASDLRATVSDDAGRPVPEAVVLATPVEGRAAGKPTSEIIDQIDKEFVPSIKPIYVGSTVSFPNRDNIRHHVYSLSPAKTFELPLYAGTPSKPVVFDKPGVVVLGCNIHDWMTGYVYVAETPYFSSTGTDGAATIPNLLPGEYWVRVWHPQMDAREQDLARRLRVEPNTPVQVAWSLKLKPLFRPHRAPVPGMHGYQ
jgi:plastocyanin